MYCEITDVNVNLTPTWGISTATRKRNCNFLLKLQITSRLLHLHFINFFLAIEINYPLFHKFSWHYKILNFFDFLTSSRLLIKWILVLFSLHFVCYTQWNPSNTSFFIVRPLLRPCLTWFVHWGRVCKCPGTTPPPALGIP